MSAASAPRVAILALGSNLGERAETLSEAVAEIAAHPAVELLRTSPVVTTKAVGGPANQPDFLNMVIEVRSSLAPLDLLRHCQAIELAHHRVREVRWAARTLDIDVIVYGDLESDDPVLTLPHPRAAERAFVLFPWQLMDPAATLRGRSVAELAAAADDMGGISPA